MIVCLWSQKQSESRHKPPKTVFCNHVLSAGSCYIKSGDTIDSRSVWCEFTLFRSAQLLQVTLD